jgi:hypothetical protein
LIAVLGAVLVGIIAFTVIYVVKYRRLKGRVEDFTAMSLVDDGEFETRKTV